MDTIQYRKLLQIKNYIWFSFCLPRTCPSEAKQWGILLLHLLGNEEKENRERSSDVKISNSGSDFYWEFSLEIQVQRNPWPKPAIGMKLMSWWWWS